MACAEDGATQLDAAAMNDFFKPPPQRHYSLELVYEWPVAGIPLGRTELGAAAIINAASRAQVIF